MMTSGRTREGSRILQGAQESVVIRNNTRCGRHELRPSCDPELCVWLLLSGVFLGVTIPTLV